MSEQGSHIATLIKPHGYKGEMQMRGLPHLLDKIQIDNPLFISIDGQRIPFFVADISGSGRADRLVVKFEFIDDIETARKFINCKVYGDLEILPVSPSDEDITSMIDYRVYDQISGQESVVKDFVKSAENPILILKIRRQEIMLPLNADYIKSVDHSKKLITVSLPEGLLDL
jgi:16S rRNA processing protein RimM